jgi:hypothetical protein
METNVVKWSKRGFWAVCIGFAIYALYVSRAQFLTWHADTAGAAHLLPPYQGIGYFVRYAFVHFWLPYVISFAVAWLFFAGAKWLNARRDGMLFEKEELYFLATGLFVAGHPVWIFYLVIVFGAYLLATLIGTLAYGPHTRISFYYFWLPCAAVTVALSTYLNQYAWYTNLLI